MEISWRVDFFYDEFILSEKYQFENLTDYSYQLPAHLILSPIFDALVFSKLPIELKKTFRVTSNDGLLRLVLLLCDEYSLKVASNTR